jgi:putative sterol carrier protein
VALFPTDEWLSLYRDLINGSAEYRDAARTWEGDIAFVLEAEPDRGVPNELAALLDLWHGECREARMLAVGEEQDAAYPTRGGARCWPGSSIR